MAAAAVGLVAQQHHHKSAVPKTVFAGSNHNSKRMPVAPATDGKPVDHYSSSMQTSQFSRSLDRILEDAHLSGELKLSGRKLRDFPKAATKYNLNDTTIADLSRNRFSEFPEDITSFPFLETLFMGHNTLRSIPSSVRGLYSLTYLDLRSNQLSALPREICLLPLQILLISNNRFVALPEELNRMDRLMELDAASNQITHLPARMSDLKNLRSLSLRNNQLVYLPREVSYLYLVSLDISNNRISSLPVELRSMPNLVNLVLENNPLISPPASVCVRGLVHVFKYLDIEANKVDRKGSASMNDGHGTLRRTSGKGISSAPSDSNKYNTLGSSRRPPVATVDPNVHTKTMSDQKTYERGTIEHTNNSPKNTNSHYSENPVCGKTPMDSPVDGEFRSQCIGDSCCNDESSPEGDENLKALDKHQVFSNIQTYKEYKDAMRQQRIQDSGSIYRTKDTPTMDNPMALVNSECFPNACTQSQYQNKSAPDGIYVHQPAMQPVSPSANRVQPIKPSHEEHSQPINNASSICSTPNNNRTLRSPGHTPLSTDYGYLNEKSPKTTETISKTAYDSEYYEYVKPRSPSKTVSVVNKTPTDSPIIAKSTRTVSWNNDIPSQKLSFTMRREFDKHKEETELIQQLRKIIESRLKMKLPEDVDDLTSVLTDGVVLCHLANQVQPRSVGSIHVPSPAVPKLTMARCRRNVDNFLNACRSIGVDEELICSCDEIFPTPPAMPISVAVPPETVGSNGTAHQTWTPISTAGITILTKTVLALHLYAEDVRTKSNELHNESQSEQKHTTNTKTLADVNRTDETDVSTGHTSSAKKRTNTQSRPSSLGIGGDNVGLVGSRTEPLTMSAVKKRKMSRENRGTFPSQLIGIIEECELETNCMKHKSSSRVDHDQDAPFIQNQNDVDHNKNKSTILCLSLFVITVIVLYVFPVPN